MAEGPELLGRPDVVERPESIDRPDLLVIGAGPAGIAAAVRADALRRSVVVVDMLPAPGGQIWRHRRRTELSAPARRWLYRLEHSGARYLGGHAITSRSEDGVIRCDPVAGTGSSNPLVLRPKSIVLATGARERFLPFPGWTLPGVTGVGGAQALVKSGARFQGRRTVFAGSGPLLLEAAATLRKAGARLVGVFEQAPTGRVAGFASGLWRRPSTLLQAITTRIAVGAVRYRAGAWVVGAQGPDSVEMVTVSDGRRTWDVQCDLLCVGYGLVPEVRLAQILGCETGEDGAVVVDELQRTTADGVYAAGELTGVGGVDLSIVEGMIAGSAAAADLAGSSEPSQAGWRQRRRLRAFAGRMHDAFALRPELADLPRPDTILCRCEDVAHGAVAGARTAREAKLHTRLGMGPCQGRVCGPAAEFLYGWREEPARLPALPTRVRDLLP